VDVRREKLTGLTWRQVKGLGLLAGLIGGVVAFWWDLDQNHFPLLAMMTWAIVLLVAIGLVKLAESIWGRYDDVP
jgi:hypothetical protein